MSTEVFCPNCGGLLFGSDAEGGRPCSCAPVKAQSAVSTTTSTSKSGKACCVCGADLAGRSRRKDKEGKYWCNECADYDSQHKRLTTGTICADCGRSFGKSMITEVGGRLVCRTCAIDRDLQEKETKRRLANPQKYRGSGEEAARKRKLMIVAAVVIVLVLIALYANDFFTGE